MRTKTITIYKFSELPTQKAKGKAKHDYAALWGYEDSENIESLRKLAEHFSGKMADYSIDYFATSHSWARFEMPDDTEDGAEIDRNEIQRRLDQLGTFDAKTLRGNGDCKLTGVCWDEDAIDGFRSAFYDGGNLAECMERAFRSWLAASQADCADFYTDEQFAEHCDANEYEFLEDGAFTK